MQWINNKPLLKELKKKVLLTPQMNSCPVLLAKYWFSIENKSPFVMQVLSLPIALTIFFLNTAMQFIPQGVLIPKPFNQARYLTTCGWRQTQEVLLQSSLGPACIAAKETPLQAAGRVWWLSKTWLGCSWTSCHDMAGPRVLQAWSLHQFFGGEDGCSSPLLSSPGGSWSMGGMFAVSLPWPREHRKNRGEET